MTFAQFVASRLGTLDEFDGIGSGQCVDLVEDYVVTVLHQSKIPGNAVDLYANADPRRYTKIANTPTNFPLSGDIVIWGLAPSLSIGVYGHCALAVLADMTTLLSLDQNWPEGARVALCEHYYSGVHGWLRPHP